MQTLFRISLNKSKQSKSHSIIRHGRNMPNQYFKSPSTDQILHNSFHRATNISMHTKWNSVCWKHKCMVNIIQCSSYGCPIKQPLQKKVIYPAQSFVTLTDTWRHYQVLSWPYTVSLVNRFFHSHKQGGWRNLPFVGYCMWQQLQVLSNTDLQLPAPFEQHFQAFLFDRCSFCQAGMAKH